MAPSRDPDLAAYMVVLSHWNISDCVVFLPQAGNFCRRVLECEPKAVAEEMHLYAQTGGRICKVPEKLERYRDRYPFRYELRFPFHHGENGKEVVELYAETVLDIHQRDPFYSTITVVKLKYKNDKLNRTCGVQT